jgi:hypothetical protein
MFKPFEESPSGGKESESLNSRSPEMKLVFSVFKKQFIRGLINIRPKYKGIEDVKNGGMIMVSENNPDDVICTYQEDSRGYILAVFRNYEDAAWFDDGLNY